MTSRIRRCEQSPGHAAWLVVVGVLTFASFATPMRAQESGQPPTVDTVSQRAFDNIGKLSSARHWLMLSWLAVGATAAVAPFDGRSVAFLRRPELQNSAGLQQAAEGALLAATLTALGKGVTGRALPDTGIIDPDNFQHAHPGNVLDRWLLNTSVIPNQHGGAAVTWARQWDIPRP